MKRTIQVVLLSFLCLFLLYFVSCIKADEIVATGSDISNNQEINEIVSLVLNSPEMVEELKGQELLDSITRDMEDASKVAEITETHIDISMNTGEAFSATFVDLDEYELLFENQSQAYLYRIQPSSATNEYQFSLGYQNLWVDMFIRNQSNFECGLSTSSNWQRLSSEDSSDTPQFSYVEDAWYYVLIAMDQTFNYTFFMWEEDNAANYAYMNYDLNNDIDETQKQDDQPFGLVLVIMESPVDINFGIDSLKMYAFNNSNDSASLDIDAYLEKVRSAEQIPTPEPEPTPVPTPVPLIKSVPLPIVVTEFEQYLMHVSSEETPGFITEMETPIESLISPEDDAYYVEFNPDRMSNLQLDRPNMPSYTWYINGSHADKIAEVVIEFDMLETINPLHPGLFGYERGYYITLHHFQLIPLFPFWININDMDDEGGVRTDVDRGGMIETPEFGEGLEQYAQQEGKHVTISIPYSEFKYTAKDLTLQFLPGTTFANLSINAWGSEELNTDTIEEVSEGVELPVHNLMREAIMPSLSFVQTAEEELASYESTDTSEVFGGAFWSNEVMAAGHVINDGGSISMPVSLYDLDEYADEIMGKYAVIPEGLVAALKTLTTYDYLNGNCNQDREKWQSDRLAVINFVLENMIDETGQFYGIYDIEQGKLVATDRKSAALPILTMMIPTDELSGLSNNQIDFMMNAIIANELVRVGDTLYYAPHGVSKDGTMNLKLSDFAMTNDLYDVFIEYSNDRSRLDEQYGLAMLLEGYANSLGLIYEAQLQTETRLPASELMVAFADNGNTYALYPSETFNINDTFFAVGFDSVATDIFGVIDNDLGAFSALKYCRTEGASAKILTSAKNGAYSERQEKYIRQCEADYAEVYNYYMIQTLYYEIWLHIYNFLQMQTSDTAYAPMYNVETGEMIKASAAPLYPEFSKFSGLIERFGTPATSLLYHLLVGVFNNEDAIRETAQLAMVNYDIYTWQMFRSQDYDFSNPDFFADNGFNVWGYDSCNYGFYMTSEQKTWPPYNKIGLNFNREDWRAYAMRKVNEKVRKEENLESLDDEFPLFYDHLPKVEIIN